MRFRFRPADARKTVLQKAEALGLMLAGDGTWRQIALEGTESWCFNQHSSASFLRCATPGCDPGW
jgi:hypothetical protein